MQLNPWPAHLPKWSALCVSIGAEIAGGMHFLHQQEIMHRDLKPENVLLDSNYHPKICDFGVARLMKEGSHQFTMTGQIGTPIYMAPEIIVGNRNRYGRGADVYSFGILMWSMWHRDIPYKQLILSEGLDAFQLAQRVTGGLRPTDAVTGKNFTYFLHGDVCFVFDNEFANRFKLYSCMPLFFFSFF
jgi:serine/threonine protein kinase